METVEKTASAARCDEVSTKSCECYERCKAFFCLQDSRNREFCHAVGIARDRPCYRRLGVSPDEQFSIIPEPDEQNVKCFKSYMQDSDEIPCSEAMVWHVDVSLPLSRCNKLDSCNKRGTCMRHTSQPEDTAECRCDRGFIGSKCETEEPVCYNNCNGRGKCLDQYCHCKPPFLSIDCSRSKVYPAQQPMPSLNNFKIYMYEISTQLAYETIRYPGWYQHDPIYIAYQKLLEQFLVSPVRTEDPSRASLFYVPLFNTMAGFTDDMHLLIDDIRQRYPFFNRSRGADHVFFLSDDRGACLLGLEGLNTMKITHFGLYATEERHSPTFPLLGHKLYGCSHPLRDVVTAPYDPRLGAWLESTRQHSVEALLAMKKRYLFFSGGVLLDQPAYSGNSRQTLFKAAQAWADPEFAIEEKGAREEYEDRLRTSRYCFAPLGWGYGMRLVQAMVAGCVPVIVQEYNIQPFEDILPYEAFSIRLTNADLPNLRELLRSISEEQYRLMLEAVLEYAPAFCWHPERGGRAFEYTIANLQRKHLNWKAMYFSADYYNETQA